MKNKIKTLFLFLLPILRMVSLQVVSDTLSQIAYPDRKSSRRGYTSYNRMAPRPYTGPRTRASLKADGPLTAQDVDRLENERLIRQGVRSGENGFHDVLMVAFDLRGSNAKSVHEWLHEQMPKPGIHPGHSADIDLDSWWVANDQRFDRSDCDSAVFVTPGCQEEARKLLRGHGLVQ